MGDEVKFTDEQWENLARAAETFASVLDEEQSKLRFVLATNWAGACDEGRGTIENLRALLVGDEGSFAQNLVAESAYLRSLANLSVQSKQKLVGVDEEMGKGISPR